MQYRKESITISQKTLQYIVVSLIFILGLLVKTYRIESGNFVLWDEAHFGKFSRAYLKRSFFFDVHPPLGKLMTAFSGYLANQDINFDFKGSAKYPESLDYCTMRRFHAFVSSMIPVFGYAILRELGYPIESSAIFSLLFVFENGLISISRLILLDSHLLFFTMMALYTFIRYITRGSQGSRLNLFLIGFSIGNVMSVKWIGCFTTMYIGLFFVYEVYMLLKYGKRWEFIRKFIERTLFLIILPIGIYVFWFMIHRIILIHGSSDDGRMSSYFQLMLKNKGEKIAKYVDYGSMVSIKSSKTGGGNLHSHVHQYPDSKIQQVTTYHHIDKNNNWAFQKVTDDSSKTSFISDGDNVALIHLETKQHLFASSDKAIISSGMLVGGQDSLTDAYVWKVEIISDKIKNEPRIKTITTTFRLYNENSKCYLSSTDKKYPNWGFEQGEVICMAEVGKGSLWNVEKNQILKDNNVEYTEILDMRYSMYEYMFELNKNMFDVNGSFKQDPDLTIQRIVSRPHEWFILKRGIRMCGWDSKDAFKFYMFGNPFIWYMSSISVILSPILLIVRHISHKRNGKSVELLKKDTAEVLIFFFGWLLHYLPFFFIGRVLYFHHYFAAELFAIMSINYIIKGSRKLMILLVTLSVITFILYHPLTYGFKENRYLKYLKLFGSWDFLMEP